MAIRFRLIDQGDRLIRSRIGHGCGRCANSRAWHETTNHLGDEGEGKRAKYKVMEGPRKGKEDRFRRIRVIFCRNRDDISGVIRNC